MAKERGRMKFSTLLKEKNLLYFTWFVSLAGTFGSLYFSEIRHERPVSRVGIMDFFVPFGMDTGRVDAA